MNHRIHQTPEERLANNSDAHLQATQENTQEVRGVREAVDNLHNTSQDKSMEVAGFSAVVKSNHEGSERVAQKVEEVKSAALASNMLLSKIAKKDSSKEIVITLKNEPGQDGHTPTKEEITRLIKPLIPPPQKGDKGDSYVLTASDKAEIAKAVKVPVVEKIIEKTEIIREKPIVTNEIREVAVGDEPDTLVEKIHNATKKIHPSRIHGLEQALRTVDDYGKNPMGIGGGANQLIVKNQGTRVSDYITEIDFTTNLTASYSNNGKVTLTASSGGAASLHTETPTGLINGSNKAYTTSTTITTVIGIWINGQYIHPSEYVASGAGFTMNTALDSSLSGLGFTISYAS